MTGPLDRDPEDDSADAFDKIDLNADLEDAEEEEDVEEEVCPECLELLPVNGVCDTDGCPANPDA